MTDVARLLALRSFTELGARQRARALLDAGSFRELLDPFAGVQSPWLERQGIVPQADDGVVVARGLLDGQPAVLAAIEGAFQGGSLGEVSGAKIAGALELAAEDNRNGVPTRALLLLETGGVRLQEANLGLAVIAGPVGCFGGMSIAAGLCSYVLVTREARLGLNGPQVIEQEAGIAEYDSRDRPFIWSLTGGEQRFASGLADAYLADDLDEVRTSVLAYFAKGLPARPRCRRAEDYLRRLGDLDTAEQPDAAGVRRLYQGLGQGDAT